MGYVSAVPVPQPRAARAGGAATVSGGRRSLAAALLLGALGATVVLLSTGQTWAEGTASVGGGAVPVEADGGTVTGVPTALAIVGLAALVAVFAVRRAGRTLVSGLLALSGAGAALAAFLGASDDAALDTEAARITGDSAASVAHLTHTPWPYVTAAGALLILAAGLLALRFGRSWPAMGGRYERSASPRPERKASAAAASDRPEDLWKALDRGEDPTHED
ncbi:MULTISPECIES: TIGR02234 family membrane protein [Streptomyces]|uniref:TIGR02234 family membrane protein n=1 Tax=Streptomyces TaxID=1883 RepID=UPI0013185916|nr:MULTISPECIES: TIGR02234 family membrane protein [Streptomyces]QGZ48484.1 TIGR02234 family membrane protein [Streptomyces sp. QHH-9511]GGT64901.1 membrane protein [Streptomyces lateritius]